MHTLSKVTREEWLIFLSISLRHKMMKEGNIHYFPQFSIPCYLIYDNTKKTSNICLWFFQFHHQMKYLNEKKSQILFQPSKKSCLDFYPEFLFLKHGSLSYFYQNWLWQMLAKIVLSFLSEKSNYKLNCLENKNRISMPVGIFFFWPMGS